MKLKRLLSLLAIVMVSSLTVTSFAIIIEKSEPDFTPYSDTASTSDTISLTRSELSPEALARMEERLNSLGKDRVSSDSSDDEETKTFTDKNGGEWTVVVTQYPDSPFSLADKYYDKILSCLVYYQNLFGI